MDMNNAKTLAVFAVIFGCFAVLYPKIFHPIIVHVVWGAPPVQQAEYGKYSSHTFKNNQDLVSRL